MLILTVAAEFESRLSTITSKEALYAALCELCERLGIRYFALSHHVDFSAAPHALRLHNYPPGWQDWYDENRFGLSDPIHRASHRSARGFYWRDVPRLIRMNRSDYRLLGLGREAGLGDGVTIPVHVPGEARGSCSFVAALGKRLPDDALVWAHMIGAFAFEGARRIDPSRSAPVIKTSDRQRECIALAALGFSNRRIAKKLGIGEGSVVEHLREARARHGVGTRTQLAIRLLFAGELSYDDVMPRFA